MKGNQLYSILSRIANIKPGEERIGILLFFYFFFITAPLSIIKPLRNAKLLTELGAEALPVAYLVTAVMIGFVVAFHSRIQVRISHRRLITGSLLLFILSGLVFLVPYPEGWKWISILFWVWANIFVVVLVTQFWIIVNDAFNPREARRLIGVFVSGGILGGIFGGALTGFLGKTLPFASLLTIALAILFINVFITKLIFSWMNRSRQEEKKNVEKIKKEKSKLGFNECFKTVRSNRYLIILASIVAVTAIVSILIDFQFMSVVKARSPQDVGLTSFFGWFNFGIMLIALFMQLLMTSNFIKRFGIRASLLLYPIVLVICSVIIVFSPMLLFAILLKGSDKSLSFTINQSVRELLYIPVSVEQKYRAKIFIDMFVNRFAKAIGSIILLFMGVLHLQRLEYISAVTVLFILGWVTLNLFASKEYTDVVRSRLDMSWQRADQIIASKLDLESIRLVFDALESKEQSPILYSMHVYDLMAQDKLTPEIRKLLFSSQEESHVSSLETFFNDATYIPVEKDLQDDEVLGKEISEITSLDVYQNVMKEYFDRALSDPEKTPEITRMEIAKGMGLMSEDSPLVDRLEQLLKDSSKEVVRYAIESAAKLKKREFVPLIVEKLRSPQSRYDSRTALLEFGEKIVSLLSGYLEDPDEDIHLKKEVVFVLSRISGQEAVGVLLSVLSREKGSLKNDLIDALDQIRSGNRSVVFNKNKIKDLISRDIQEYYRTLIKSPSAAKAKEGDLIMNTFKLMGLVFSHRDILNAYQNIKDGSEDSRAYAAELLDNVLSGEFKEVMMPLIEDIPQDQQIKRARAILKTLPKL